MAKVEILTGAERQRRWSTELKLSILQEAFSADGTVSDVARRHDVLPQQIYAWRKKLLPPESPQAASFIPVSLIGASESVSDGSKRSSARSRWKDVEIVLRNGRLLRIAADMDLEVLSSLVACVEAA
ncbi:MULTISPECIES: IS66-like element accessory protein TnpA [Rhizobium]|uniref:Putative insertion sequence protein n=2 Tax=Rhizobium TaxID=379 RepID=A0A2K9ZGM1_RHILE|nr:MULTISPECIES: transposase [Rhizobium]AUW47340.1 putative insertion sequence protein [Rhizobium leguminosarum]AUW47528.1 putative insertion sequence protein [Rhizobium leguminosarum]MBY5485198.1 transposase [Rhizobium leguminosarum]TBD04744.1 transposase [Rhizobium leguminosarum]TBD34334.1 transposase [Rhizobium ruizarguesonis]